MKILNTTMQKISEWEGRCIAKRGSREKIQINCPPSKNTCGGKIMNQPNHLVIKPGKVDVVKVISLGVNYSK